MYLMKDTKDGYKYFKLFFEWGKEISEKGVPAYSSYDKIKLMKV